MGKIKTLRADVYKKIAAGEVVERPLSAVKELVENSIDAGADTIKVEIIEGGKRLIKVVDNGSGFDPEDIEPAFKNNSTSKISDSLRITAFSIVCFNSLTFPGHSYMRRASMADDVNLKEGLLYFCENTCRKCMDISVISSSLSRRGGTSI